MRLKLYCNRFAHFKDALVCSVSCPFRTRCQDFALFYDANRGAVDSLVEDYYSGRSSSSSNGNGSAQQQQQQRPRSLAAAAAVEMRELIRLEVKREMADVSYIWIGKDDQAELLEHEEVIKRAERGAKAKSIYKVAQEMELRFQLVPRKRIDKAKRTAAVEAERAAARSNGRRPRPVPVEQPAPAAATPLVPVPAVSTPPATRRRKAVNSGQ